MDIKIDFDSCKNAHPIEGFNVGDDFYDVYIYLNTPGYRINGIPGWRDKSKDIDFQAHIRDRLKQVGMSIIEYMRVYNESMDERLYIHPDHLNGVLKRSSIVNVCKAIEASDLTSIIDVGIFTRYERISNDELMFRLQSKESAIADKVLELCKTTRKTKFASPPCFATLLKHWPGFCLYSIAMDKYDQVKIINDYVYNTIIVRLVNEKRLDKFSHANGNDYYRTLPEKKSRKRQLSQVQIEQPAFAL